VVVSNPFNPISRNTFFLIDVIAKKNNQGVDALELKNVKAEQLRAET
jgi:hypothetical protein